MMLFTTRSWEDWTVETVRHLVEFTKTEKGRTKGKMEKQGQCLALC